MMTDLERLKIAANNFYLELGPTGMTDQEYDELALKLNVNPKDLVDWDPDLVVTNEPMEPLRKTQVVTNDLHAEVKEWSKDKGSYQVYPKYDGCSIKAYYHEGKLQKIVGTPDVKVGIMRSQAFLEFFPEQVPVEICSIQGEVLVDFNQWGPTSRNKANGLTNSKFKINEVHDNVFIRWYKLNFVDGNWSLKRQLSYLDKVPILFMTRTRDDREVLDVVFHYATQVTANDWVQRGVINEHLDDNPASNLAFQADGIVAYSDEDIHGFKFYYLDAAITTIRNIAWNHKDNGSFAAVLEFDTVTLDGKSLSKASAGSIDNILNNKMGIGAMVRVAFANSTIPKVIEVIEGSTNIVYPACECGYQTSYSDVFGAVLKCGNPSCSFRTDTWSQVMDEYYDNTDLDHLDDNDVRNIISCLYIDRFDVNKLTTDDLEQLKRIIPYIDESITTKDSIINILSDYMSSLQKRTLLLNYDSWRTALMRFKDNHTKNSK